MHEQPMYVDTIQDLRDNRVRVTARPAEATGSTAVNRGPNPGGGSGNFTFEMDAPEPALKPGEELAISVTRSEQ